MTTPGSGAGRAHREGPVRHESGRLAGCSDRRQPTQTFPKLVQFCTKCATSFSKTVVRSRPVLGQAHTPRRRLFPFVVLALAVLVAPAVGGAGRSPSQASSLRAQDAAIVAKSRAAVLGLYSLDQRLASAQARLGTLRAQARTPAHRAHRASRHELAVAQREHAHLAAQRLGARLRVLYEQGERRAARDRVRSDEPRRGAVEPRQPHPGEQPGRGRAPPARRRRGRSSHDASRSLAARTAALAAALGEAEATTRSLEAAARTRSAYIDSLAAQAAADRATALCARGRGARGGRPHRLTRHAAPATRSTASPQLAAASPVAAAAVDHGVRDRLLARRHDRDGPARRLGRRRRRSVA